MSEKLVIEKALRNLQTIGCKVGIIDSKGNTYGDYKLVSLTEEKKKRGPLRHKRGTIRNYLSPYLDQLTEPGDVIDVPLSPIYKNTSDLSSSVSAYMCNNYGKQSSRVETINENTVRVFRKDPND